MAGQLPAIGGADSRGNHGPRAPLTDLGDDSTPPLWAKPGHQPSPTSSTKLQPSCSDDNDSVARYQISRTRSPMQRSLSTLAFGSWPSHAHVRYLGWPRHRLSPRALSCLDRHDYRKPSICIAGPSSKLLQIGVQRYLCSVQDWSREDRRSS